MISKKTYTLNAICGLIQHRAEVKAMFSKYEPIHWSAMAHTLAVGFCRDHGLAFARDQRIPAPKRYDPDWEVVATVARVIAAAD